MSESVVHKRLKLLGMKWLKTKVTDLVCIEAKYRNMRSIADVCGINLKRKEVRIIEVKATKQDYLRDKKLFDLDQSYYKHCQYFYILCPENVIQLDEVPTEYGLLWADTQDNIIIKRSPTKYKDKTRTRFETSLKNICRALTNNYLYKYVYPSNNIKVK
jgi:hypothetical protein